ncbi:MATE family efflux transporter [Anaerocolumna sedimenticola]|uniref:Probable multidrug resistance protein NorM n=1 Tax=Anaerocolumna sedimenticola TaxID=2696063 RepID=A0A6P1TLD1_9FIRM|nr:MATE family efflux transporter [Anaerocolumna sedimenticola]QHQ60959.1 MATE family efflux transporter [Anaerocolumna sedimenticola]
MADTIRDMTVGKPSRLILGFALPLMIGNIFQQTYTLVDTIVVGQVVGVEALASLGAAEWPNWMVLGMIVGFTQGFSILIAQRFGARDNEGLKKAVGMSVKLAAVIAVFMLIISQLLARPVLEFLHTPENILSGSLIFLRIAYLGVPVIMAYNTLASILRALGDGKTPLISMIIASAVNILLDCLFVMGFQWGIAGAATATLIAQICSCIFCYQVIHRNSYLKMSKKDWELDFSVIKKLIALGIPSSFQNGIIAVGGLVVQYVINGFGFIFVAGFTATNKLYGLLEIAATSFGFAAATFTGQNLGAGKIRRIREGMRSGIIMAVITSGIISIIMLVFGRHILGLFISGTKEETTEVIKIAYRYLSIMAALLFILYLLHLYRSALQGMGDTITPMISGIVELCMRVLIILILPKLIGDWGVYFAEVAAWTGAEFLLMVMYYVRVHRFFVMERGLANILKENTYDLCK